jgi:hypothetical protein
MKNGGALCPQQGQENVVKKSEKRINVAEQRDEIKKEITEFMKLNSEKNANGNGASPTKTTRKRTKSSKPSKSSKRGRARSAGSGQAGAKPKRSLTPNECLCSESKNLDRVKTVQLLVNLFRNVMTIITKTKMAKKKKSKGVKGEENVSIRTPSTQRQKPTEKIQRPASCKTKEFQLLEESPDELITKKNEPASDTNLKEISLVITESVIEISQFPTYSTKPPAIPRAQGQTQHHYAHYPHQAAMFPNPAEVNPMLVLHHYPESARAMMQHQTHHRNSCTFHKLTII